MESISDIKRMIESVLEHMKDDGIIKVYGIESTRDGSYTVRIHIKYADDSMFCVETKGFGYEHDTKIRTWENMLHRLLYVGIKNLI